MQASERVTGGEPVRTALVDIVSFSIAPALVLLSVGDFGAWFNAVAILNGWPVWPAAEDVVAVLPFLDTPDPPHAAPSIVNADELGLARWAG